MNYVDSYAIRRRITRPLQRGVSLLSIAVVASRAWAAENPAAAHFRKEIQPILTQYCSDCHADGAKKGNVAFDEFKSDAYLTAVIALQFMKKEKACDAIRKELVLAEKTKARGESRKAVRNRRIPWS